MWIILTFLYCLAGMATIDYGTDLGGPVKGMKLWTKALTFMFWWLYLAVIGLLNLADKLSKRKRK